MSELSHRAGRGPAVAWLPNALTLSRAAAAPAFLFLAWGPLEAGPSALFALFAFAALTDLADGALARWLEVQSPFGAWLDPFADKALVLAGLVALTKDGVLAGPHLVPVAVIVLREAVLAIWRVRAFWRFTGAPPLAKAKTAAQMAAIGLLLAAQMPRLDELAAPGLSLLWLAAALGILSLNSYRRPWGLEGMPRHPEGGPS